MPSMIPRSRRARGTSSPRSTVVRRVTMLSVAAVVAALVGGGVGLVVQRARREAPRSPERVDAPRLPARPTERIETEEVRETDLSPNPPRIVDASAAEDHDVVAEESLGEGGLSPAPFEAPSDNSLIGIGGGAGGAFHGAGGHKSGGAFAPRIRVRPPLPVAVPDDGASGGDAYPPISEDGFVDPRKAPLSTFAADVDTASYAIVRRMLSDGQRPPPDAVRVEELVNYFPYEDEAPSGGAPVAIHAEVAACPWSPTHRLVRIGVKAREVAAKQRPRCHLVFLLDVSGSMADSSKLPLVKTAMRMLLEQLRPDDTVGIVTYAGESGVRLRPTPCERRREIQAAIDGLEADGSTNGASGIALAYGLAAAELEKDAVNRVVLCTDGDFNVGVTSHAELLALITEKAKSGVFLTVLGFGMGNLKDDRLELLADKGNGTYGYVDSTREAHRLFVEQTGGTLETVAKDVKLQVELNPAAVAAYRLVGYEDRRLAARDFKDDAKDAGDLGAGHAVTAFYEIVPAGAATAGDVDPLKYQHEDRPAPRPAPAASTELLTVKVRWKEPQGAASSVTEVALVDSGHSIAESSRDFRFGAAVASFALLLRGSAQAGTATYDGIAELAGSALGSDTGGWRHELVELVAKAKALAAPAR
jgi:Ca-activated chloride channel family protein